MHASQSELDLDPSTLTDNELIHNAMAGEQDAYTELVRRYKDRLLTSLRADVGCAEAAEDIVQDAFVRAFLKLSTFRCESSFYTWLFRIALNSRRYYMRNRNRTTSLELVTEATEQSWLEPQESPDHAVESKEECRQVRAALRRLDDHHRAILMLREFDGCDYQTISQELQVTMGTVRSRLSRARAQLRKELAAYWTSAPEGQVPRFSEEAWSQPVLSLTA